MPVTDRGPKVGRTILSLNYTRTIHLSGTTNGTVDLNIDDGLMNDEQIGDAHIIRNASVNPILKANAVQISLVDVLKAQHPGVVMNDLGYSWDVCEMVQCGRCIMCD